MDSIMKYFLLLYFLISSQMFANNNVIWSHNSSNDNYNIISKSDNDSLIAVCSEQDDIFKVIDAKSGEVILAKDMDAGSVEAVFSEDFKIVKVLNSLSQGGASIVILDVPSNRTLFQHNIEDVHTYNAKFAGDSLIIYNDIHNQLHIYNYIEGELVNSLDYSNSGFDFDFTSDNSKIIIANMNQLRIVSFPDGALLRSYSININANSSLNLSDDEKYIFLVKRDLLQSKNTTNIIIYDYLSGEILREIEMSGIGYFADYNPDNEDFLFRFVDKGQPLYSDSIGVFEWNVSDSLHRKVYSNEYFTNVKYLKIGNENKLMTNSNTFDFRNGDSFEIERSVFDELGNYDLNQDARGEELISVFWKDTANIYAFDSGDFSRKTKRYFEFYSRISDKYCNTERVSDDSTKLYIYDYQTENLYKEYEFGFPFFLSAISPDLKSMILINTADTIVEYQLYDLEQMNVALELAEFSPREVRFSNDSKYFYIKVVNFEQQIWSLEDKKLIIKFKSDIETIGFMDKDEYCYIVDSTNQLILYNLKNVKETKTIQLNPDDKISNSKFSKDDKYFIYDNMNELVLFDMENKSEKGRIFIYDMPIRSYIISDDYKKLALNYEDGTMLCVDIQDITSVLDEKQDGEKYLKIYPNPGRDNISIEFKNNLAIQNLAIFDIFGNKVYQTDNIYDGKLNIDIRNLTPGAYVINAMSAGANYTQQFIKIE